MEIFYNGVKWKWYTFKSTTTAREGGKWVRDLVYDFLACFSADTEANTGIASIMGDMYPDKEEWSIDSIKQAVNRYANKCCLADGSNVW